MRSSLIILGLLAFTGFVVAQGSNEAPTQEPSLKRLKIVKRDKTACSYCKHYCSYDAAYGGLYHGYLDCYNRLCLGSNIYDCVPPSK